MKAGPRLHCQDLAVTTARIERALQAAAYIVMRHGEAYAPLMDRLEAELEAARRSVSTQDRAQRILRSLTRVAQHVDA